VIAIVDNATKKDMMGEEFVTPCKQTGKRGFLEDDEKNLIFA